MSVLPFNENLDTMRRKAANLIRELHHDLIHEEMKEDPSFDDMAKWLQTLVGGTGIICSPRPFCPYQQIFFPYTTIFRPPPPMIANMIHGATISF